MRKRAAICFCTVLILVFNVPAFALNIDLSTSTGLDYLTIDGSTSEFTLNLVWDETPAMAAFYEKFFSIPDPFDLISISTNSGGISNLGDQFRAFSTPSSGVYTDPLIATLTFSVDLNAAGGDYIFEQFGSGGSNFYVPYPDADMIYFQNNPFTVTLDRQDTIPNPVPEPATMMLLGTGLVGLAGFGRKKSRT